MSKQEDRRSDTPVPFEADKVIPAASGGGSEPDHLKVKDIPLPLKIMGALCAIGGVSSLIDLAPVLLSLISNTQVSGSTKVSSLVIYGVLIALLIASAVLFVALGVRLIKNKRKHAAHTAEVLIGLAVLSIIATLMLFGLSAHHIAYLVELVVLIALISYLDPALAEERALQRKLKKMDTTERKDAQRKAEEAKPKKGFITLNFFNIFWIFIVCCILGLILETIFHFVVFGEYQDRTGMLFGPFSPIYGFGALLMTIALNRFHDKPLWIIFLISAVIGGGFEYFTSWIMEFAFGIVAWDYSGTFMSIDGRTNFIFMVMWGILGCCWIKFLLPHLLKLINIIPWNWRYSVTTVCTVLMLINAVMSIQSLDCWYQRVAGATPTTGIEQFYADHFDNDFMQNRFQTMSMDPENATRVNK